MLLVLRLRLQLRLRLPAACINADIAVATVGNVLPEVSDELHCPARVRTHCIMVELLQRHQVVVLLLIRPFWTVAWWQKAWERGEVDDQDAVRRVACSSVRHSAFVTQVIIQYSGLTCTMPSARLPLVYSAHARGHTGTHTQVHTRTHTYTHVHTRAHVLYLSASAPVAKPCTRLRLPSLPARPASWWYCSRLCGQP